MKKLNMWIDQNLFDKLKQQSKADNRTISGTIRMLIEKYINNNKEIS